MNLIANQTSIFFQILPKLSSDKPPDDGAYINGLFLDGCRWDYDIMKLGDQKPKVLNEPMPAIWLQPIEKAKSKVLQGTGNLYMCPVYKTSERRGTLSTTGHSTNFVLPIYLPSQQPVTFWTKRGAALLCQLDN
ncbi:unnamed protein product [Dibothriocephalus latus]|uniref:Dynein heavy chain C-terminal domain-containing protein n=1 Tax=Dibothriocephalus latus TaxID=60516 RepID=A0A3P7LXY5_DIBLA|nr:unnamed protein product [Dibothriocephalus latus]